MRFLFAVLLIVCAGCSKRRTSVAEFRELCSQSYPSNRTINIVFHGHSVPAGYFKTPEVRTFDAYPNLVHRALKERFTNATINVIVTARGGEESDRGAARFHEALTHKPDLLFIDYALNDRRIGLDKAASAWRTMIRSAHRHGIPVVLLTPSPDLNEKTDTLQKHAAQVRKIATEESAVLVDVSAKFASQPTAEVLMSQANHPNREGHQIIAKLIIARLIE